jgi:hypothetical protein
LPDDVPSATVVKDGKLEGDVPKAPANPFKRRLSNFLLDRSLQLRYTLVVTILSAIIAGSLGYLINEQRHSASSKIEDDLVALTNNDPSLAAFQQEIADDMTAQDHALVYTMIGIGVGLVIILSGYLVIMTHKVAGPLFKTSTYFDRMADGRLGAVSALRRGDMLQDFFLQFKDTHEVVRARFATDLGVMENATQVLRAKLGTEALAPMDAHLTARKAALQRQEWTASQMVVTSIPKGVAAAALVWIALGAWGVYTSAQLMRQGWFELALVVALVAAFFLISGIRTLTGKQETLSGIATIAIVLAFLDVAEAATYGLPAAVPHWAHLAFWATAACLAVTGAFALFGGNRYAAWATARSRR